MKIAVSACLLGENCKYNGGNNYSKKLVEFLKGKEVISICPEVLGGLPIPRKPAEIVDGEVKLENGSSVDYEFKKGAQIALDKVIDNQVDLVILQSRSPSCGVNNIYDGSFSGKLIDGKGVFAKLLVDNGIDVIDVEDLYD
ncbi:DUF523 domain-containing protein [Anaerococcus sp. Marseille-Q7828]|uniref:DUF523 domain-containing protein n=1 Tax=Anaerococcus sp. Marseille-Q7828 TaxID=3036300 RepID=UPI0024AD4234|nr:DUF523 domain-containing protein [Anaerococcus sp. Marseille-Q7828]